MKKMSVFFFIAIIVPTVASAENNKGIEINRGADPDILDFCVRELVTLGRGGVMISEC